jgi:hypothetical protein
MAAMTTMQPLMLFHVSIQGGRTCRNASRSSNVTSDSINRHAVCLKHNYDHYFCECEKEDELQEILDY